MKVSHIQAPAKAPWMNRMGVARCSAAVGSQQRTSRPSTNRVVIMGELGQDRGLMVGNLHEARDYVEVDSNSSHRDLSFRHLRAPSGAGRAFGPAARRPGLPLPRPDVCLSLYLD